ncbi:MAG: gamma carbonic anhydrase family protein [Burkholderiales bacterium]|nr:gamma carbonic anhydrase family protein [Burkholderiales bacterium]
MPVYSLGERKVQFRGPEWYIAPDATVIGAVVIGNEASVWFKCVIRGDNELITIGDRSNIQDTCVLHPDPGIPLTVGASVSVGHMVMLHGCTIGDGCLIGIGAVVMNHAVVGKNTLIGANTLIPEGKRIPEGVLVLGQPGKVVRDLKPAELELLQHAADSYVAKSRRYRRELVPQALPGVGA